MGHVPSLEDLALFVGVVRAGGFRAAAAERQVPRSTISRRLAALEAQLGFPLLQRTTSKLVLTDLGGEYFERIARVVDEARALAEELGDRGSEPTGTLRVAASQLFAEEVLPPLACEYLQRHPRVRLELVLAPQRMDLIAERIDLAFRTGPLDDASALAARRLGTSINGFFASPAYIERRGRPETPDDLRRHDAILVTQRSAGTTWAYRDGGALASLRLPGRIVVNSYQFAHRACREGAGIARVPTFVVADDLRHGRLVGLLEPHWVHTDVFAVYPRGPAATRKTRAFLDLVCERFAGGPPWEREQTVRTSRPRKPRKRPGSGR